MVEVVQARLAREWSVVERRGEQLCWCEASECWCSEVGTAVVCLGRLECGDDLLALRLLGLARHGDVAAARVVLQALLPHLELTLRRGERLDDLLGLAWERVVRHRPCSTSRVMENLARACRRHASNELDHRRQHPVAHLGEHTLQRLGRAEASAEDPHAEDVVADAFRLGVIDGWTAELLRDVYVLGMTSAQAGALRGLSADAVRDRCRRALKRIRDHARRSGDVA